jgi:hypothetical protein
MRKIICAIGVLGFFISNPTLGFCAPPAAGSAAVNISGLVTVCVKKGTTTPRACKFANALKVQASVLDVGRASWDGVGNTCTSAAETISVPGTTFTISEDVTLVGTIIGYDATSQTGTASVIGYVGGSCDGANFNQQGATKRYSSEARFVISDGGKRIDGSATKITFDEVELGTFSIAGYGIIQ